MSLKWRPDIFEHTGVIFSREELENVINNIEMFVAKINNNIVGYVLFSSRKYKRNGDKYRKELNIEAIRVEEKYGNKGVETKLLDYTKEYAKDNHYTYIKLTVSEENVVAKHLYEKLGFTVNE